MKKLPLILLIAFGCDSAPVQESPPGPAHQREAIIEETAKTCMSFVQECEDWTPRQRKTVFDNIDNCDQLTDYAKERECYAVKTARDSYGLVPSACEHKFNACIDVLDRLAESPVEVTHDHNNDFGRR